MWRNDVVQTMPIWSKSWPSNRLYFDCNLFVKVGLPPSENWCNFARVILYYLGTDNGHDKSHPAIWFIQYWTSNWQLVLSSRTDAHLHSSGRDPGKNYLAYCNCRPKMIPESSNRFHGSFLAGQMRGPFSRTMFVIIGKWTLPSADPSYLLSLFPFKMSYEVAKVVSPVRKRNSSYLPHLYIFSDPWISNILSRRQLDPSFSQRTLLIQTLFLQHNSRHRLFRKCGACGRSSLASDPPKCIYAPVLLGGNISKSLARLGLYPNLHIFLRRLYWSHWAVGIRKCWTQISIRHKFPKWLLRYEFFNCNYFSVR